MPAIDHPVHERTKVSSESYRWGCWNRPRDKKKLTVKNGYENGRQLFKDIDDFGSPECRHDTSLIDWFCKDCQWVGTGEEYARSVQMRAELCSAVRTV